MQQSQSEQEQLFQSLPQQKKNKIFWGINKLFFFPLCFLGLEQSSKNKKARGVIVFLIFMMRTKKSF